jgi:uncharacterized 2Fe-2S/4Fe-4S cluster protein (DUF4445 family)
MAAKIRIFQDGKVLSRTQGEIGQSLLEVVSKAGHFLDAPCGGNGRCGKCLVRLSPDGEEVKSCRTYVQGDTDIYLPSVMNMKIAETGAGAAHSSENANGPFGVAIDIGTTTVVAHLTDLPTKARIATASGVNAQRTYGADVISRIQYCAENGHETLTKLIRGQIAQLINQTLKKAGKKPEDIKYVSVAGNTVMEHLFANLSPVTIGVAPFKCLSLFGSELTDVSDLPVAKDAKIYMAPAVASYVGGDITAGMLASDLDNIEGTCVYLDIGTNGEIAMKVGDKYYCCATAAGPAFEGAEISKGMAAITGAVNHAQWVDGKLVLHTVGDAAPVGLCGSGLLDVLSIMLDTGVVDETGRLLGKDELDEPIASYAGQKDGKNVFWVSKENDVYMNSDDVRKLQLAKSAISAGIRTLMHHAGVEKADWFLLAGGFGSYMDKSSGARIGMFPAEFVPVTRTMGNTAGEGAALTLCSEQARKTVEDICARCEYIELSESKYFNEVYIDEMMFPDPELFR